MNDVNSLNESPSNRDLALEEERENREIKHMSKDEALKVHQELFKQKAEPLRFPDNPSLFFSGPRESRVSAGEPTSSLHH